MVVSPDREWTCTLTNPPAIGETVRVLSRDGVDIGKAQWGERSHLYFYGWAPLDKIPRSIKERILANYPTEPTMTSYEWLNQPQFRATTVLDPDGWDRSSSEAFDRSMREQITEQQFVARLQRSTVAVYVPPRKLPITTEIEPPRDMEAA